MPWFGELPERWDSSRIKNLFMLRDERNFKPLSEVRLMSLYTAIGVKPHDEIERVAGNVAVTANNYKKVFVNDIIVNIILCWMGAIGISKHDGVTSPAYDVYRAVSDEVNADYYNYLFRTPYFSGECYKAGRGIMAMRWRTYSDQFTAIPVPLPPRAEQDQIARYLDWKVSGINRLINAKKKQIVLLGEQKQAVINEAVTRGGDGWEDISLGNLGSFRKGFGGSRADDSADGVACIRYGDIYRTGALSLTQPITRINILASPSYARVYRSEMLFALSGETKEEIGQSLINNIDEDTWSSGDAAIFAANSRILPQFLVFALRCPDVVKQRASVAKGDIIVHISTSALRRLRIFAPPISEQQEIATYLSNQCERIDKVIEVLTLEINLFAEYRTRLISDVVTGKLDVRDVVVPEYKAVEETADVFEGDTEEVEVDENNVE